MKTRLLRRLALFLPLVLAMAGTNYCVDPANLWSGREKDAAAAMRGGSNVTGFQNIDERLLQRELAAGRTSAPDLLVVGSSRSMQIGSELFRGRSLFNASVSRSTLEDLVALSGLYRGRGLAPKTLIVGVDPWLFNPGFRDTRWQVYQKEFDREAERLGLEKSRDRFRFKAQFKRWAHLASPSYFQASIRSLREGTLSVLPTKEAEGEGLILRADGSLSYPRSYRERSPEQVRGAVETLARKPVYSLEGFSTLDAARQALWGKYLDSLGREGIRVVLWLAPYHPALYRHLTEEPRYRAVAEVEGWVRETAARRGIAVVGSYDPAKTGAGEADFYDEMHPREALVRRLLEAAPTGP